MMYYDDIAQEHTIVGVNQNKSESVDPSADADL